MNSYRLVRKLRIIWLQLLLGAGLATAQTNPVPFLSQALSPMTVAPGGPGVTLTVNGAGFTSASVVNWNTTPLRTTFISASQLTAVIQSAEIAAPGTATVTVSTPGPGGGTSNSEFLTVSAATTPTFTNYSVVNPPTPLSSLVMAPISVDVNGDGKLDILSEYGGTSNQFAVLLGKGDGSFQPPTFMDLSNGELLAAASNTSVGDFNGDGKVDVVVGDGNVLLGNGDGTFGTSTVLPIPTGNTVTFTAVGDFNQDGKLDVVTGNNLTGSDNASFSVFLGNGDGSFNAPVNYQLGGFMGGLAAGDFNGDGKLDLVTYANAVGLELFLGNGDGTFGLPSIIARDAIAQMVVADVNGDGKLDILATGDNLTAILGNGDGTFKPAIMSTFSAESFSLTAGDFNADGKLDAAVVAGDNSQTISILYGNGDGAFQPVTTYPSPDTGFGSVNGDFNGDGKMDLFMAPQGGQLLGTVLLQGTFPLLTVAPGSLTFPQQTIATTSTSQSVALSNTGNAVLALSNIALAGADAADYAQSNTCGATLAANASCQVNITFTPTAPGTRSAALSITNNAPGSPQSISLTGVTTPAPAVTVTPASISFPGQYVGTSGLPQNVTIANTGNAALAISSVTASPTDFGVLSACGSSLAAGASCQIGVFFDPTVSGARNGTLTISSNVSGSPTTVALSGMGQDFSFSASSSTNTISPGQTANYTIAVNPIAGFNQTVALSCSGAPTGSTCSLSSNSAALTGSSPVPITVSVTTVGSSTRLPAAAMYLSLWGFPGMLLIIRFRRSHAAKLYSLSLLAVLSFGISGCGGGSGQSGSGGTPANTYQLMVTGTFTSGATTLTHNTQLTLVVQ